MRSGYELLNAKAQRSKGAKEKMGSLFASSRLGDFALKKTEQN